MISVFELFAMRAFCQLAQKALRGNAGVDSPAHGGLLSKMQFVYLQKKCIGGLRNPNISRYICSSHFRESIEPRMMMKC